MFPRDHFTVASLFKRVEYWKRAHWTPSVQTSPSAARSTLSSKSGHAQGQIIEAMLDPGTTPAEIEDPSDPRTLGGGSHRSGTKNSHIVTLVERHSRYTMLIKIPSKETTVVVAALSRHIRKLPLSLCRSLTLGPRTRNGPTQNLQRGKHRCEESTSVIPTVPGSALAQTKTPTGCCGNTCLRKWT